MTASSRRYRSARRCQWQLNSNVRAIKTLQIIKKVANAFYKYVEPSDQVRGIARFSDNRYKKKHGGLWVGGEVVLNSDSIMFAPNAMNARLHNNLHAVEIAASNIELIRSRFGWFTRIVEVKHKLGMFRFRCYGAKNLVERYLGASNSP